MPWTAGRTVGGVDVCLRNGTRVLIRPITADDKPLLVRGMAALSPQSARLRFLAPKHRLTLSELRYLTEVDHVNHYALVAVLADDPTTMAGVGRWVRDREHPDAVDTQHGRPALELRDPRLRLLPLDQLRRRLRVRDRRQVPHGGEVSVHGHERLQRMRGHGRNRSLRSPQ